jgi:hypothetical protein
MRDAHHRDTHIQGQQRSRRARGRADVQDIAGARSASADAGQNGLGSRQWRQGHHRDLPATKAAVAIILSQGVIEI